MYFNFRTVLSRLICGGNVETDCDLPYVKFCNNSKNIFDFTERNGVIKERSDKLPLPIEPKVFNVLYVTQRFQE